MMVLKPFMALGLALERRQRVELLAVRDSLNDAS